MPETFRSTAAGEPTWLTSENSIHLRPNKFPTFESWISVLTSVPHVFSAEVATYLGCKNCISDQFRVITMAVPSALASWLITSHKPLKRLEINLPEKPPNVSNAPYSRSVFGRTLANFLQVTLLLVSHKNSIGRGFNERPDNQRWRGIRWR